jgi:hypothetical protein
VVLRDKTGVVTHVAIGQAILDADWGGALSMLPSGEEAEGLADFFCDTPGQARQAMDELAELGCVPFHPRDFAPKWFSPRRGIAAVTWLLGHRSRSLRLLTDAVCAELEHINRVLESARRSGYRFHVAEVKPKENLRFAGPALQGEPENNQMQRTAPAGAMERRR